VAGPAFARSDRSCRQRSIGIDESRPSANVRVLLTHGGHVRSELTNMNIGSTGLRSLVTNNCGRI